MPCVYSKQFAKRQCYKLDLKGLDITPDDSRVIDGQIRRSSQKGVNISRDESYMILSSAKKPLENIQGLLGLSKRDFPIVDTRQWKVIGITNNGQKVGLAVCADLDRAKSYIHSLRIDDEIKDSYKEFKVQRV